MLISDIPKSSYIYSKPRLFIILYNQYLFPTCLEGNFFVRIKKQEGNMDILSDFTHAFYVQIDAKLNKSYIQELINQAQQHYNTYGEQKPLNIVNILFDRTELSNFFTYGIDAKDIEQDLLFILRSVLIDYLWLHNMHYHFLPRNEIEKLEILKQRNDYKSKLFTKLLYLCELYLKQESTDTYKVIKSAINMTFRLKINEYYDEYIRKNVAPISKFVTRIVGHINPHVFISFYKRVSSREGLSFYNRINYTDEYFTKINKYITLDNETKTSFLEPLNYKVISLLDREFISKTDITLPENSLYILLDLMRRSNLKDQTINLVDYLLKHLVSKQNVLEVVEKGYPVAFGLVEFKNDMIEYLKAHIKNTYSIKDDALLSLGLYPLTDVHEIQTYIKSGRQIFLKFIQKIYGDQFNKFIKLFESPETIIRAEETGNQYIKYELKVKSYYDFIRITMLDNFKDRTDKAITYFAPDYYDNEKALHRFYLTSYLVNQSRAIDYDGIMFGVLNFMFQLIENKFGLVPIRQHYIPEIESKKQGLNQFLLSYGLNDKGSNDYYIAFLDREVATIDEQGRFPVLEQMGDAIYEFVIAEAELWDLDILNSNQFTMKKISYVSAEKQQKIANRLDLESYYISYPFFETRRKIDFVEKSIEYIEDSSGDSRGKSYLADSLEMLIGAIYFDKGIDAAIDFTKKIVFDTFPELNQYDDVILQINNNSMIDIDSLTNLNLEQLEILERVKPGVKTILDIRWSDQTTEIISVFGSSLLKFITLRNFGNETLEKRKHISHVFSTIHHQSINDVNVRVYLAYLYLNFGLEAAETAFSQKVLPKILKD